MCSPVCSKKILWRSCDRRSPDAWPELAYGTKEGQLSCLPEATGAPKVWLKEIRSMRWNGRMYYPSWGGDRHGLGEGVSEMASKPLPYMPKPAPVPLPSHPWSHPADEWLHCSMGNLQQLPKSQEYKSRTWWCNASPHTEEKPRKQV